MRRFVGPTRNERVASVDRIQSSTAVEVKTGRKFPPFEEGWLLTLGREARSFAASVKGGEPTLPPHTPHH